MGSEPPAIQAKPTGSHRLVRESPDCTVIRPDCRRLRRFGAARQAQRLCRVVDRGQTGLGARIGNPGLDPHDVVFRRSSAFPFAVHANDIGAVIGKSLGQSRDEPRAIGAAHFDAMSHLTAFSVGCTQSEGGHGDVGAVEFIEAGERVANFVGAQWVGQSGNRREFSGFAQNGKARITNIGTQIKQAPGDQPTASPVRSGQEIAMRTSWAMKAYPGLVG